MNNKFFIDTEFLEGKQTKRFLGIPYGKTPETIDLISIALVDGDNSSYYGICKEFNVYEAWNRYDKVINKSFPYGPEYNRVYWIRQNVLKPVFDDLVSLEKASNEKAKKLKMPVKEKYDFSYRNFKRLLNKHGKTKQRITEDIKAFTHRPKKPEFYGYYADYDWVVFCWLFGRMLDLPKDYPMYCRDLKQMYDEENLKFVETRKLKQIKFGDVSTYNLKELKSYPQQKNAHNALNDAKWNKELYQFLNYKP